MNSLGLLLNDMNIHVCFSDMKSKKHKDEKMKEIVSTFCAVLNSQGGSVTLTIESGSASEVKHLKRAIEQRLADLLGFSAMCDHINLVSSSTDELTFKITVKGIYSLHTMNYNLYVPSKTQFLAVLPKTPIADIKEILTSEKRIVEVGELVKIGTHHKEFVFQQNISDQLQESRTVQLKYLKAEKSKCVSLGDRMTNKANKLSCYASAFANHLGGHIYYGIQDDSVVKGEFVEDKAEIIKKVSKAINKMVWPKECEVLKRGEDWDIFFESVNGENGNVVPSTFLIVIYIASCPGGVFTEEPESYHIVSGEVEKMALKEWKERIILPTFLENVARLQWSSGRMKKLFYSVIEKMIDLRNSGNLKGFERFVHRVKEMHHGNEIFLTVLAQEATFASRRNELVKAGGLIEEYDRLLYTSGNCENVLLFQCLSTYIKSTKERSAGKYEKSFCFTTDCLQNVEFLPPGFFSACFYLHAASLFNTQACKEDCKDRRDKMIVDAKTFYTKALEHVKHDSGSAKIAADIQQNIYIHLAFMYLSCSGNGAIAVTTGVSQEDITRAKNCLMVVEKLIVEGHPLNSLRLIRYLLAQSSLVLRQSSISKLQTRRSQLESSLWYSEKALNLAKECHFGELVLYCHQQIACVTEEIVRDGFRNMGVKKVELFNEL